MIHWYHFRFFLLLSISLFGLFLYISTAIILKILVLKRSILYLTADALLLNKTEIRNHDLETITLLSISKAFSSSAIWRIVMLQSWRSCFRVLLISLFWSFSSTLTSSKNLTTLLTHCINSDNTNTHLTELKVTLFDILKKFFLVFLSPSLDFFALSSS
jgi:hypothetical protein